MVGIVSLAPGPYSSFDSTSFSRITALSIRSRVQGLAPRLTCGSALRGQRSISGFFNSFLAIHDLLSKAPVLLTTVLPSCNQVSAILEPVLLLVRSTDASSVIPSRLVLPEPTCFIDCQCCQHFKSYMCMLFKCYCVHRYM